MIGLTPILKIHTSLSENNSPLSYRYLHPYLFFLEHAQDHLPHSRVKLSDRQVLRLIIYII